MLRRPWIPVVICAALLLPGLHTHPAPPPASWCPPSATAWVTDTPCLACSFSREGRFVPVTTAPGPAAAADHHVATTWPAPQPARRPHTPGPLPPRGPPAT